MNHIRTNLLYSLFILILAFLSLGYNSDYNNLQEYVCNSTETNSSESSFSSNVDFNDDTRICIVPHKMEFSTINKSIELFEISCESAFTLYTVWQPPKTS